MPSDLLPPARSAPTEGIIPEFFCRWLGQNWRTDLSGRAAYLGCALTAIVPFFTGNSQKVIAVIASLLTGQAIQQGFANAKDKAVTGVEKK